MALLSAVATASVAPAEAAAPALLTWMPSTHFSANARVAEVSRCRDCSRLRAINGMRTLSSNWPCIPPTVIAVSLPITCAETCSTTSGSTGLTLPGMIEEPFCSSGRKISPIPVRGPEPISARSPAIFVSETATTFSAPESSTSASRLACASNGSRGAAICLRPDSFFRRARTFSAKRAWVFRPVPVAVPPSGICPTCTSAACTRSWPRAICAA